jgi:ribokinase
MIIVFGSLFMDVALPVATWPERGSIAPAGDVTISTGGKGGNQALAALRGGAKVHMVGQVGDDIFGTQLTTRLRTEGVSTSGVGKGSGKATGVVGILYEPDGVNTQIASPGANRAVTHDQIPDEVLKPGTTIMTGLCLPREQVRAILERARARNVRVILNVSPIKDCGAELARLASIIMVNADELEALGDQLGVAKGTPIQRVADIVAVTGNDVIATLGGNGVVAMRANGETYQLPVFPVHPILDTNGAGDCFAGFFVSGLEIGLDWAAALTRANVAAALSCRKVGAMDSYPYLDEVEQNLGDELSIIAI